MTILPLESRCTGVCGGMTDFGGVGGNISNVVNVGLSGGRAGLRVLGSKGHVPSRIQLARSILIYTRN